MERVPQIIPWGKTRKNVGVKRGRIKSSPTGKTPLRDAKSWRSENFQSSSNVEGTTSLRWNSKETQLLRDFISQSGGLPKSDLTNFWIKCANYIYKQCGSQRTAKSCEKKFGRDNLLTTTSVETGRNVHSLDAAVQTEISLLEENEKVKAKSTRNNWQFLAITLEDLVHTSKTCVTDGSQAIHRRACDRLHDSQDTITAEEQARIMQATLDKRCKGIAEAAFSIIGIRKCLWTLFLEDVEFEAAKLANKNSVLINKDYEELCGFSWDKIILEMSHQQSLLMDVLLAVALPTCKIGHAKHSLFLVPRIGLIYGMLMQARFHSLSRIQRVVSVALLHNHAAEKIFDILQACGLCLNYGTSLNVSDMIGGHFNDQLIASIRDKKKFRFIGDNINFEVGVRYERSKAHKHMLNWFGSAAIIQTISFLDLPDTPQGKAADLKTTDLVPSTDDLTRIKSDYCILIGRVACEHLDSFAWLRTVLPKNILGKYSHVLDKETPIIPLPVRPFNEQKYSEVVQILSDYEEILEDAFHKAGESLENVNVHIGGDQLTRERFSGAKRLRVGSFTPKDRFDHLKPITFEFFHLEMKILKVFFKVLFNTKSEEIGTMNAEKIKLSRHSVNSDVKNHYNADKDFAVSFINSYIVESLCEFFGMKTPSDVPTIHLLAARFETIEDQQEWIASNFGQYLEEYIFNPVISKQVLQTTPQPSCTYLPVQVSHPDGTSQVILLPVRVPTPNAPIQKDETDHTKAYAHNVLQWGLLYKQIVDMCKVPDRSRIISTLKLAMVALRNQNSRSKYALEILRFLCHQQAVLSPRMAHESLYGLFVNQRGKIDSNFPADLAMEHLVKIIKLMLKHMGPNKGEQAVIKRTMAITGMETICKNFMQVSQVIDRAKGHKDKDAKDEEVKMIKNLRTLRPFLLNAGGSLKGFEQIKMSCMPQPDNPASTNAWLNHHKRIVDTDISK